MTKPSSVTPLKLRQVVEDLQELVSSKGDMPIKFYPTENSALYRDGLTHMNQHDTLLVFVPAGAENEIEPDIEPPLIPLEFLHRFFLDYGAHVLIDAVERRNTQYEAITALLESFMWAIQVKREAEQFEGLVLHETNERGREVYFTGLQALYALQSA